MTCAADVSYNINGTVLSVPASGISTYNNSLDVCKATKILEKLHKDFTEKYTTTGVTAVESNNIKPSYYLRNQPTSNSVGTDINRSYNILTNASGFTGDDKYRKMVSVIMKGEEDNNPTTYDTVPNTISSLTSFDSSDRFKGIYGINRVIEILDSKINTVLGGLIPTIAGASGAAASGETISKYNQRKDVKNTLEEIAYRENQIYREKFLHIILVIVGIFLVGSQLAQKYFSGGGGGVGGGGGGLGGLFGFGVGGGGGLFSRFGGLGLGSSGRSHFDIGNLFKKSSYTLQQR